MNYLVTGGAGFIGSHLVERLLKAGHRVTVIDNLLSGSLENLNFPEYSSNLKVITRSITEPLEDIFNDEKFDALFHLAALPSVQFSIQNPVETNETNVDGTLNLLDNCRAFGVKRFIFSSSCAIYGNPSKLPTPEDLAPNPLSPYALHKIIGEQYCTLFTTIYGMECISLRYFNVFGPKQNPNGNYASLIPKFITMISQDKSPVINGNGAQTRDFIFVSDVVEANIAAANTQSKECFGKVFNVGSGVSKFVNQITGNILSLAGKKIEALHGPPVIEPENALADIAKAKQFLDWEPRVSFEDGLKETYSYFIKSWKK